MSPVDRRSFIKSTTVSATTLAMAGLRCAPAGQGTADRPNILWLTIEDLSPVLGCYGDVHARTPNLDKFATESIQYDRAYASAPVCGPARSTIITGVHACSMGTQNLRMVVRKSPDIPCYTEYLRKAGYYCTNNKKEDYQFETPANAWDESSNTAHWRKNSGSGPFFSIFNFITTHQGQTRYIGEKLHKRNSALPPELRHDPSQVPVPDIYPDTPLVRENMAALYTQVTLVDQQIGVILQQLEDDGLAEDTIVFFYADHGTGLPRGKRWLHETGLRVPFIVRFPEKYRHLAPASPGSKSDRIVSFLDLAPTMLSLTGLPIPTYMQGTAFLGEQAGSPREDFFATRDRVGELLECNRSIRDARYHYIRNFYPHRPRMQMNWYSEVTPIRREVRRLDRAGALSGTRAWLAQKSIPPEELYDVENDSDEMHNLADSPEHQRILTSMRERLYGQMVAFKDTGILPEGEMHRRSGEIAAYDMAQKTDKFPVQRVLDAAKLVGMGAEHKGRLDALLGDSDAAVRYWAATGLAVIGAQALSSAPNLKAALQDESQEVRVAAADALCQMGDLDTGLPVLAAALESGNPYAMYEAATVLQSLGKLAAPVRDRVLKARDLTLQQEIFDHRRSLYGAVTEAVGVIDGNHDAQALFETLLKMK
jgi:N-sulfoglucosamine sulfohydrolase